MGISVVRRFHMDINGAAHALTEDEAIDLARALIAALGSRTIVALAEGSESAVMEPMAATVDAPVPAVPAALPSGPVVAGSQRKPGGGGNGARWHSGLGRIVTNSERAVWIAEEREKGGKDWIGRAATRCEISTSAVRQRLIRQQEAGTPDAAPPITAEPQTPPIPALVASPIVVDETRSAPGWTLAQTKALIREMGAGSGNIREAAARTGHTMGSCALRWRHLKEAGLMRIEDYMKSPEAVNA